MIRVEYEAQDRIEDFVARHIMVNAEQMFSGLSGSACTGLNTT